MEKTTCAQRIGGDISQILVVMMTHVQHGTDGVGLTVQITSGNHAGVVAISRELQPGWEARIGGGKFLLPGWRRERCRQSCRLMLTQLVIRRLRIRAFYVIIRRV